MAAPLVIATVSLTGLAVAGLVVDVRGLRVRQTRSFGLSAIVIKAILAVAFLTEILHIGEVPDHLYENFPHYLTFFALVAASVPLMCVVLACEAATLVRLRMPEPTTHHVEHFDPIAEDLEL